METGIFHSLSEQLSGASWNFEGDRGRDCSNFYKVIFISVSDELAFLLLSFVNFLLSRIPANYVMK